MDGDRLHRELLEYAGELARGLEHRRALAGLLERAGDAAGAAELLERLQGDRYLPRSGGSRVAVALLLAVMLSRRAGNAR